MATHQKNKNERVPKELQEKILIVHNEFPELNLRFILKLSLFSWEALMFKRGKAISKKSNQTKNMRIIFFLMLIALTGCASSSNTKSINDNNLLLNDSFSFSSPIEINKDDLTKDISNLVYALKNGYGGRKFVPEDSLNKAVLEISNLSNNSNEHFNVNELCNKIAKFLNELPDNHLSASLNGNDCNKEREKFFNQNHVGKNLCQGNQYPWALSYKNIFNQQIPVVSIISMPAHEDKSWNGFLEAILEIKKTAHAIIIDLRGNGGGDDTMGRYMATYLYGQDFPSPWEAVIKSQTPSTLALAANNLSLKILRLKNRNKQIPTYLVERLAEKMKAFNSAINGELLAENRETINSGPSFDPQKAYTKPIYLLIDNGCQSSCESTVEEFESHPYAITIGENTGGFIHFGNMGQLVLPHSKIIVQMATDYWKRRDGQFFEKKGYYPKIPVPRGNDALDIATIEIEKYLKLREGKK